MRISGFKKQVIVYVVCFIILIGGVVFGTMNIKNTQTNNDFWIEKRIGYSKLLPSIEAGEFADVTDKFFISKKRANEQSVYVISTHNVDTLKEGSIVPTDVLFQNEVGGFFKEYPNSKTGCITFILDNDKEAFLTFLFDLSEYKNIETAKLIIAFVLPMAISVGAVVIIILLNIIYMKRRIYRPIKTIGRISQNICNGNYDNNYLDIGHLANDADEMSNLIYSFELMRDELKTKEEQNQQLSQSEKELISCISHDLQTPLATIKAYGEGIRDNIASTEEEKKKYIEVIINKTNIMIEMIKDLLEFSNAQINQLPMEFGEVMSLDYFDPLLEEMQNYAKQKGVMLTYEIEPVNVILRIDKKRITQVMYNLVENAMKYMDKDEKQIKIKVLRQSNTLQVKVSDNGMGISSEELLFIFDKFYRAEKSRSSSVPGAGLGLSICKYIIKEHDGDIWCDSKVGVGSTFRLLLPLE